MQKEISADISKYSGHLTGTSALVTSDSSLNIPDISETFFCLLRDLTRLFYKEICCYEKIQALKPVFIKLDFENRQPAEAITEWFNELILYFNEDSLIFSSLERVDNCPQNSIMVSLLGEKIDNKIHSPLYSRINSLDSGNILISRTDEKIFFKLPLDGSPAKPDKFQ
jgi:hypothetical protein